MQDQPDTGIPTQESEGMLTPSQGRFLQGNGSTLTWKRGHIVGPLQAKPHQGYRASPA